MSEDEGRLVGGRYRLGGVLGRGGMGTVWRGEDEVLGRSVAVKELRFPSSVEEDEKQRLITRTLREAKAIARIRSGSAVTVFDVVDEDDRPWIVMELVEGASLADHIRHEGPLTPRRAAEVGLAVLDVLRAAHREGVLHRDVKPSNVLLEDVTGRVVLTDFGIAKVEGDPSVTSTGMLVGAPSYISPERARGKPPGPPADLWSLGALLYAAVEGRPPYDKGSAISTLTAVMTEPVPPPQQAGELDEVIFGLLTKDPDKRLDVAGARALLEPVASGEGGAGAAAAPVQDGGTTAVLPPKPDGAQGGEKAVEAPEPGQSGDGEAGRGRGSGEAGGSSGSSGSSGGRQRRTKEKRGKGKSAAAAKSASVRGSSKAAAAGAAAGAGVAGAPSATGAGGSGGGQDGPDARDGGSDGTEAKGGKDGKGGKGRKDEAEGRQHGDGPGDGRKTSASAASSGPAASAASGAAEGGEGEPAAGGAPSSRSRSASAASASPSGGGAGSGGLAAATTAVAEFAARFSRRTLTVAAVAVAAVLALLAVLSLGDGGGSGGSGDDGKSGKGAASSDKGRGDGARKEKQGPGAGKQKDDGGEGKKSPSPGPDTSEGGDEEEEPGDGPSLPDDYTQVTDKRFHFSMAMPEDFKRSGVAGSNSGAKYSGGGLPKLQVDFSPKPLKDAAAGWRDLEPAVKGNSSGYRRISIKSVQWRGYPTVGDWQFERDEGGDRVRVLNRGFRADDSHGYAIMITCKAGKWDDDECRTLRETAFKTFKPLD
ncbi:serine/threonine protein kinase [Streptomyces sp. HNM0575]|uniref:serine/threonine-protein kinase n=1 Tax=Streptomyces sp. HNM0575 TaxID=2716338 RepID=UPI00145E97CC|nr:serine/threonine-protein kinase [Streptomyces sp. HNM0575]NLU72378.1 serine/threonine protein kinase [Streptomyces sp. HNM0575]